MACGHLMRRTPPKRVVGVLGPAASGRLSRLDAHDSSEDRRPAEESRRRAYGKSPLRQAGNPERLLQVGPEARLRLGPGRERHCDTVTGCSVNSSLHSIQFILTHVSISP